jgi:hypothetical protein
VSISKLSVRVELVEALSFFLGSMEGQGFDKLSPNGITLD